MYASLLSYPSQLALFMWALGSLNATMSLSFASKLLTLPRVGTPLLRLQIERLKLNENRMSHKQQREHNVVLLRRG